MTNTTAIPSIASIKDDLLRLKPQDFLIRWFLKKPPYIFGEDNSAHNVWKKIIAEELGVSLFDLMIVGSAAVGRSLNPAKNLAAFTQDSDIDIAVVSAHYFDLSWRWMRRLGSDRYRLPKPAQDWIKEHEARLVYWGAIATDQLLQYMPFGPTWVQKIAAYSNRAPADGREINLRLYRDHESLEAYLTRSIRKTRSTFYAEKEIADE